MKAYSALVSIFIFFVSSLCRGQEYQQIADYQTQVSKEDLSFLFLKTESPLGFIGDDYQRFYIHFTSVKKNPENPFEYLISGKTRVKENITSFSGTAYIYWAITYDNNAEGEVDELIGVHRAGHFRAKVYLKEDKSVAGSGELAGVLFKGFIVKKGKIADDEAIYYGDQSYDGNNFEGYWISNATGKTKRCSWNNGGGNTLDQNLFKGGEDGDLHVNSKYNNKGWKDFNISRHSQSGLSKKEIADSERREKEKWWERK